MKTLNSQSQEAQWTQSTENLKKITVRRIIIKLFKPCKGKNILEEAGGQSCRVQRNTAKKVVSDFQDGPVVKNPSVAAGITGSIPGLGRYTRCKAWAPQRPGLQVETPEPSSPGSATRAAAAARSLWPATRERPPLSATTERPSAANKRFTF